MNGVIYCATNKINGKQYIGQSWDFERRKYMHIYGKSGCQVFNRAMRKHGAEAFTWLVLFEGIEDQAELDTAEDWAIWQFRSLVPHGYNQREGGSGNARLCEASREKHRISTTEKNREIHARQSWKENHAHGILERTKNPLWRMHQAEAAKRTASDKSWREKIKEVGRRNSENQQWREKTAAGGSKNAKPVICLATGQVFKSVRDAAKKSGVDASMIIRVCKGTTQKTAGGFTWAYYQPSEAEK